MITHVVTRWPPMLRATSRCLPITTSTSYRSISGGASWHTDTVDTCVVGGGIIGCSVAYHLARRSGGRHRVVLLEKTELTAGSTWHAAGLITFYHPGVNVKRLHYDSINLYAQLPAETGQQVGFHRCGSLRVAHDRQRLDEFHHQLSRAGHLPGPLQLLSPSQMHALCPLLDVTDVTGGLYTPYDGHIDPYSLTQALAVGARLHGVQLLTNHRVTALNLNDDASWSVQVEVGLGAATEQRQLKAARVVNAAGFWARDLGRLCGLRLPLVPVHHQYVITNPLDEVEHLPQEMPVLRDLQGSYYARQERGGLLIGPYEHEDRMCLSEDWMRHGVSPDFGRELFAPDLERIEPNLESAMRLLPCFQHAQIRSVVNGPITYTPDILPIVGPTMAPNMWVAAGFGYGIAHAGGTGKFIADWILEGEAPYDLTELDPGRYGDWTSDEYILAVSRQSYGMNTAVAYPREERCAGRPTNRVSGAYAQLLARGACMQLHAGWEQADWFCVPPKAGAATNTEARYCPSFRHTNWHEPVVEECRAVTQRVGVIDLTPFGKLRVSGRDATALLRRAIANKLPSIGRTVVTHCLTPRGCVMAELTVTREHTDDDDEAMASFLVVTGGGSELHDLRWLQQVARDEKLRHVQLQNISEQTGVLSVAGPRAGQLLESLLTPAATAHSLMPFPFLTARRLTLADVPCLAVRITYTGELGWELYHERRHTSALYAAIVRTGEPLGLADFGTLALNALRIEKGFRAWGREMNCDCGPLEAGLDMFLRSPHDFIGRDALEDSRRRGLSRQLVLLAVDSADADPHGDESVLVAGEVVGHVTSGCYSPHMGRPLAMAYVPPYLAVDNTRVHVQLLERLCDATVMTQPPVMTQPARQAVLAHQQHANNVHK